MRFRPCPLWTLANSLVSRQPLGHQVSFSVGRIRDLPPSKLAEHAFLSLGAISGNSLLRSLSLLSASICFEVTQLVSSPIDLRRRDGAVRAVSQTRLARATGCNPESGLGPIFCVSPVTSRRKNQSASGCENRPLPRPHGPWSEPNSPTTGNGDFIIVGGLGKGDRWRGATPDRDVLHVFPQH